MCACFSAALSAQCYAIPIFSRSVYEGTVLVGSNFQLCFDGKVIAPLKSEALVEDIRSLGGHGQTVREILALLPAGGDNEMELEDITSMFELHSICLSRSVGGETLVKIRKKAALLRFGNVWKVTTDSLVNFLAIISGSQELDDECPIRADTVGSTNVVELALGLFGTRCPSFRIPGGSKVNIEKALPTAETPLARGKDNKKRANPAAWAINVRMISMAVAISDWESTAADKEIRSVAPSAAKNAGFRSFDSADRVRILAALREAVHANPVAAEEQHVPVGQADESTVEGNPLDDF
jgi:hypothetical protein